MLQDFIIIVQPTIPISTAAPTHYVRFSTHISYTFPKFFQKFFGPFLWSQVLLPSIFEFPFSRYVSPYFFPTFRPLFSLPSSRYSLPSTSGSSQYSSQVQSPCLPEPGPILLVCTLYDFRTPTKSPRTHFSERIPSLSGVYPYGVMVQLAQTGGYRPDYRGIVDRFWTGKRLFSKSVRTLGPKQPPIQ